MKIQRVRVMVFIILILASCVGCGDREGGGCSCFSHHYVTVEPPISNLHSINQGNQSGNENIWQNVDNLGPNKATSGISSRNMIEESSGRGERRDRD